jgi:hypothetical protein
MIITIIDICALSASSSSCTFNSSAALTFSSINFLTLVLALPNAGTPFVFKIWFICSSSKLYAIPLISSTIFFHSDQPC